MAILATNADYTDRDKASLDVRARGLIVSAFPDWTDDKVANVANLLVELFNFVGDTLAYYQDNNARESRITTALLRKNLLALVKLVSYVPAGAKAATATVTFTLAAPVPGGRTVTFNPPATPTPTNPTTVSTEDASDPILFELTAPVVITAGNSTGTGVVENSVRQDPETFSSTLLPNQEVRLSQAPFLPGSEVVSAGNGSYSRVDDFLQSTSSDRHYVMIVDDQDRATLRFGNGINGAIPTGDINVSLYKTGGGKAGIVGSGTIKKILGQFQDSSGAPVTVTVSNAQASDGGDDRESNAEIKENSAAANRTQERTVGRTDFEDNAKQVPGIERALFLTKNEDGSIAENAGYLYVVPTGLGFPSVNLKNDVLTMIKVTKPHHVTFNPTVTDPVYVDIGVKAVLYLKPGFVAATVRLNILSALVALFAARNADDSKNELVDFGFNLKNAAGTPAGEFTLSDVEEAILGVNGVREVGDLITDFQLNAYRVTATTTSYTGGGTPAVLVQAYAHTYVPLATRDWPRLKRFTFGGSVLDVDLTIDGTNFPPS